MRNLPHPNRFQQLITVFGLCLLTALAAGTAGAANTPGSPDLRPKLNTLQIPFIKNQGQTHPDVAFYAKSPGGTIFITRKGELVSSLGKTGGKTPQQLIVRERLLGADPALLCSGQRPASRVNYFKGADPRRWKAGVPTYDRVSLGEAYDGIEVSFKAYGNRVEKLFWVKPGADPGSIRVQVDGARSLHIAANGGLALESDLGPATFTKPVAFQEINGQRRAVDAAYRLSGSTYGFTLGDYDKSKPVVIDPMLSTFIGGSGIEYCYALTTRYIDELYVYITGYTQSKTDFPEATGVQPTFGGGDTDVFIARLDTDLRILDMTYLGGSGDEEAFDVFVHHDEDYVYVTGYTESDDFPTAPSAGRGRGVDRDCFITRLNLDLSAIEQSRYLGGNRRDHGYSIALDSRDDPVPDYLFVAGGTTSNDLPLTAGSAQPTHGPNYTLGDGFVAKLDLDLSLVRVSYLGGKGTDSAGSAVVHPFTHDVYVGGRTSYDPNNGLWAGSFPWLDPNDFGGQYDGFIVRMSNDLASVDNATYLGGTSIEFIGNMALNYSDNKLYVVGGLSPYHFTYDFPATAGGFQEAGSGDQEAFVARLDTDLNLEQASYYGGTYFERGSDIVIDQPSVPGSDIFIAGWSESGNLPGTDGGANPGRGSDDVFVARINSDLTVLEQATYVGGSAQDECMGKGLALGNNSSGFRQLFVGGETTSDDLAAVLFTDADSTAQPVRAGSYDVFVSRITPLLTRTGPPDIELQPRDHDFGNTPVYAYPQFTVSVENMGGSTLSVSDIFLSGPDQIDYSLNFTPPGTIADCLSGSPLLPSGERCGFSVTFHPTVVNDYRTAEVIVETDNDTDEPLLRITLSGYSGPDIKLDPARNPTEGEVEFPVMEIGTSIREPFTISNVGYADLHVGSIIRYGILPDTGEDFALHYGGGSAPCAAPPFTLAPSQFCTIEAEFAPTVVGSQEAVVLITSDDLDEAMANVYLMGTGVEDLQANIWSHDLAFHDVVTGSSRALPLIVSNTGGEPLEITGFTLSDPANFSYDYDAGAIPCLSTFGWTLPSTEFCSMSVTFNPVASDDFAETLTIHSNDPDSLDYTVNLTGRSGIDTDGDGVIDIEEAGDANGDGTPDSQQAGVASLHSYDGEHLVVIESQPEGTVLEDVRSMRAPDPPAPGYSFPYGYYHFTVVLPDGASTAVVTITLPEGSLVGTWVKNGPEPCNAEYHYYDFGDAARCPGAVDGVDVAGNVITLSLEDGSWGDRGLTVDSKIEDPGGPVCIDDHDCDGYDLEIDCDDSNPAVHPGAFEVCNEIDDDCDEIIDEGCGEMFSIITDTAGGLGSVAVTCAGEPLIGTDCYEGAAVSIEAVPGYITQTIDYMSVHSGWQGDLSGHENPVFIEALDRNINATALFSQVAGGDNTTLSAALFVDPDGHTGLPPHMPFGLVDISGTITSTAAITGTANFSVTLPATQVPANARWYKCFDDDTCEVFDGVNGVAAFGPGGVVTFAVTDSSLYDLNVAPGFVRDPCGLGYECESDGECSGGVCDGGACKPSTATTSVSSPPPPPGGGGGGGVGGGAPSTTTSKLSTTTSSIAQPAPDCVEDSDCDDGVFCNGAEFCDGGVCAEDTPPCGPDELCMKTMATCWDIERLTAESLSKRLKRPIFRDRRCTWLVLKGSGENHYTPEESTLTATCSQDGGTGLGVDESRSPIVFRDFIVIPICIEKDATVGDWTIEISTEVPDEDSPHLEIITATCEVMQK